MNELEIGVVRCEDCGWFVGYVGETKCTTCRVEDNHKLGLHDKVKPTKCALCQKGKRS